MKVELKLSPELTEAYAVIHAPALTEEIRRLLDLFSAKQSLLAADARERTVLLRPADIYMVQVEDGRTNIRCEKQTYTSGKRLYEWEALLGDGFMRISKGTLVNLSMIDSIAPSFQGAVYCVLKNGCKDYISRKYLPAFKAYFGL